MNSKFSSGTGACEDCANEETPGIRTPCISVLAYISALGISTFHISERTSALGNVPRKRTEKSSRRRRDEVLSVLGGINSSLERTFPDDITDTADDAR